MGGDPIKPKEVVTCLNAKIGTEVPIALKAVGLFVDEGFRKVGCEAGIMIAFAFHQNPEVVFFRGHEDTVEDIFFVAVHQIQVVFDEVLVLERILNEAVEQDLVEDDRLFDDERILWNQFVSRWLSNKVGFHLFISQAV